MRKLLKNTRVMLAGAAIVFTALLVFNSSFFGLVHNLFVIKKLNQESARLDAERATLQAFYDKIQSGDESYIENAARARYDMSAPRQYEVRFK